MGFFSINLQLASLALMTAAMPALAQPATNPIPLAVELAVPFGTVPGRLLLLGNHMVFLDDQQQAGRFSGRELRQQLGGQGEG